MSAIKLSLLFSGSLGEKKLLVLFDEVATYSCIDANMLDGLADRQKMARSKYAISSFYKDGVEVAFVTLLDFYIHGVRVSDEFLVVPNLNEQVVIGNLTIRKWRIKTDKQNHSVEVDARAMILRI